MKIKQNYRVAALFYHTTLIFHHNEWFYIVYYFNLISLLTTNLFNGNIHLKRTISY